ncbi:MULTISPECIES: TonB C-terminal domain-containing protein [unclassified Lysobacter]|uniref:TonB C-terminal domain-containing protein n=1 Tax=unclassified Lysobacter TaxID=2635362 RepID=UPI001BE94AED|nr:MULTISPECIES: TonB C-terminal domain-containing protein [unclassified Lysobacter]MBT2745827.1 hypothetical protein [Lysobacter sp. ISL-42]MBT2749614.1 hypothetical protein [Lysobacter sp. ISL-50]MBT2778742.1 hypothetical protein [Lysobacter sp. ISL-54]MBT2781337.1 hypothetical protein [Lysobacter sp. ISL-52]
MAAFAAARNSRLAWLAAVAAMAVAAFAPPAAARRPEPMGADCSQPERCLPQNQLRYYELLRENILQHWHPPSSVAADSTCTLDLRQLPGGQVVAVKAVDPCDLDEAGRSSLLAAVRAAQPLPYEGYEQVFQRQLRLNLRAQEPDEAEDSRVKRWWRRLRER